MYVAPIVYVRSDYRPTLVMSKIKIKCSASVLPTRADLLQIMNNAGVRCSKLITVNDGEFLAYCSSDMESDKLFDEATLTAFNAIHCAPVMPPHFKAKRTVVVKRLDDHIYSNVSADILL